MQPRRARPRSQYPQAPARRPPGRGLGAAKLLLALLIAAAGGFAVYRAARLMMASLNPPPPPAVQEPAVDGAEWDEMTAGMRKLSRAYSGNVGIYMKDLRTGRVWEYNADERFRSASLVKLPIMAAVFEKIESGALSLDTQVKLTGKERVGGSGSLKWVPNGTSLSVMELIYKMITESDNTATRMLIDKVGMGYLSSAFEGLGLKYTNITQQGMSLTSRPLRDDNFTTAREMAGLLERIYEGALVNKEASGYMLDVLKHNKSRNRLRRGLPIGWEIGHKTGLERRSCHDVGIVFSPRGDYVIAVLTGRVPSYSSAKSFIARMARLTYKYYKVDSGLAALPEGRRPGEKVS